MGCTNPTNSKRTTDQKKQLPQQKNSPAVQGPISNSSPEPFPQGAQKSSNSEVAVNVS